MLRILLPIKCEEHELFDRLVEHDNFVSPGLLIMISRHSGNMIEGPTGGASGINRRDTVTHRLFKVYGHVTRQYLPDINISANTLDKCQRVELAQPQLLPEHIRRVETTCSLVRLAGGCKSDALCLIKLDQFGACVWVGIWQMSIIFMQEKVTRAPISRYRPFSSLKPIQFVCSILE
ncbi:hypothetical protein [Pseudomonas nitroreducens]|uniref:hypothetical protein n=1 Tax=Pseudomonas nitroreducens TaxID=46680 RepID=UPI00147CF78C|nr:hypothetical protein [Pseudomonas nitroreducens]NNN27133.1 hypothetical protein [Pseudomonas nitroreducens]